MSALNQTSEWPIDQLYIGNGTEENPTLFNKDSGDLLQWQKIMQFQIFQGFSCVLMIQQMEVITQAQEREPL